MDVNAKEILKTIFELVLSFSKQIVFNADAENLSSVELYVLMYLAFRGSKKMSEIASEFSMTKSNTTFLIDSLQKKHLVERRKSQDDRRVIVVELTKEGHKLCQSIIEQLSSLINLVVKSIPPKDLEVISDGFERLVRFFNSLSANSATSRGGAM